MLGADIVAADKGIENRARWYTDKVVQSHKNQLAVNVKDYGLTGTADDAATFQAALDAGAGGPVFVPAGTYTLGTISVPAGTTLFGLGTLTTLKAKDGLDADLITNTSGDSDITIRDLRIDGNKATMTTNVTARGVYLLSCARVLLTGLHVFDVEGHGIHLSNGADIEGQRVSDTVIERCGSGTLNTMGSCFAVTSASGLTLTNVHAYDSSKAGFRLSGSGITLNGCIARRNANGGIVPVSGDNSGITVNGGFYQDNGIFDAVGYANADGIRLLGSENVVLNGPVCSGNQGAGVGIYSGVENITIVGGVYKNNGLFGGAPGANEGRDGISIDGNTTAVSGVTITGVRCYDDQGTQTQQYGIRLRELADFVTINPSDLRGNLTSGYRNDSTTATSVFVGRCQGAPASTVNNTSVSVTGVIVETDARVVTVPAGSIGRKGGLRLRASGTIAGIAGTKVVRLKFGASTAIAVSAAAGSTSNWSVEVDVWNTGNATQNYVLRGYEGTTLDVMTAGTFAVDTTVDISVGLTVTLGVLTDTVTVRTFDLQPI